jgi:hypothetical protein
MGIGTIQDYLNFFARTARMGCIFNGFSDFTSEQSETEMGDDLSLAFREI